MQGSSFNTAAILLCLFLTAGCSQRDKAGEWLEKGDQASQREDYDEAVDDYTRAIELDSRLTPAYVGRGTALSIDGKFAKGIQDLTQAIRLNPRDPAPYEMRGYANFGLERFDAAVSDYNTALNLNPVNRRLLKARGQAYYWKNDRTNAIADFTKALHFITNDPEIYALRGNAYFGALDTVHAMTDYQAALGLDPENIDSLYQRARLYSNSGQYTNAIRDFKKVIKLRPRAYGAYNLLAWLLATCPDASVRDGSNAVLFATKACELSNWKRYAEVDTLAAAYAESGDFTNAVIYQRLAAALDGIPDASRTNVQYRLKMYLQHQPYRRGNRTDD